MGLSSRKPHSPSPEPIPKKKEVEVVQLRVAANDNIEEKERVFGSGPELKVVERDTKIGEILKREFKGLGRREEDLKFLIFGAGRKVDFTRGWSTKPENFTFIESTGSKKQFLEEHGYDALKKNAEMYIAEEKADIVVALDEEMEASWRFLKNVAPNGYLLCRVEMAKGAERTGKYEMMGVMSVLGNQWSFLSSRESGVVENDAEFEKAPKVRGAVSYEEAREVLEKLHRPTNDVFTEYQKLINETIAQNENAAEDGETTLTFTDPARNISLEVNTVLPRANGSDEDIYVLKKKGSA